MIFIMKTYPEDGICKVKMYSKHSIHHKFIHIQIDASTNKIDVRDFALSRDEAIKSFVKNNKTDYIIEVISSLKFRNQKYYSININESKDIRKLKFSNMNDFTISYSYSEKLKRELKVQRDI